MIAPSKLSDHHRQFVDPCALTPRERELIAAYIEHRSYRGVAEAVGVKAKSLHDKFGLIRGKLGVDNNKEIAAAYARIA